MRRENLFRNKATKGLVAALAVAMATTVTPVNADAASAKKVTIAKGDTVKKAGKKGSFKTNKKKVAKVNKNGKITAVKAGKAKITAKTKKGKKVTYNVTVKKAPTISKKKVSVTAGNSKKVTVNKNGAKYLKVSFKSSNPSVATVNKNGKITGVAAGSATVTATVKGHTKNYKLKVAVTVNAANVPDDNQTTPPDDNQTTPTEQNLVITEGTNLVAGTYNTVTIKSSVPANATVALGAAKIKTLYVESGSEYNVDAVQAEIENIEVVGSGQATAKATRVAKAPRINLGNNANASKTKMTLKADAYFAGSAKLGSVSILAAINAYFETAIGQLSVEGNAAKISLHGAVDELSIKGENASVGVYAAVTTMKVEGKQASVMIAKSIVVTTMTIIAENAAISGNGTVSDLSISAAGVVVQTAVTKATVDASVTAGATIGGQKVNAGATVSNVSAVAGQTDTDPVAVIVDQETPGTNQGGSSGGSSGGSVNNNVTYSKEINVYSNTQEIVSTVGTEVIKIKREDVMKYLNDAEATQITVYQGNTTSQTARPVTIGKDKHEIRNAEKGKTYQLLSFQGIYQYNVWITVIGTNVANIKVDSIAPSSVSRDLVTDTKEVSDSKSMNSRTTKNATVTYTRGTTSDTVSIAVEEVKKVFNSTNNTASGEITAKVNGVDTKLAVNASTADINGSYIIATFTLPNTKGLLVLRANSLTHDTATGYNANVTATVVDSNVGTVTLVTE